jgi:tRNA pseudouridine38-40 synthase
MNRYKVILEYNGSYFNGWQKQPNETSNLVSIQNTLEKAIFNLTQEKSNIVGAGRTDAGVHALGQVAHFDLHKSIKNNTIKEGLNFYLKGKNISVVNAENLGENSDFHARFSAKKRQYVYKIFNKTYPPIIYHNLALWIPRTLNTLKINQASQLLVGTHDFTSFRSSNCYAKSPIKTIDSILIDCNNEFIEITITAQSFLYHMVRNIVGALIQVGLEKITIEQFNAVFEAKNKQIAPSMALACGLYFNKVLY